MTRHQDGQSFRDSPTCHPLDKSSVPVYEERHRRHIHGHRLELLSRLLPLAPLRERERVAQGEVLRRRTCR